MSTHRARFEEKLADAGHSLPGFVARELDAFFRPEVPVRQWVLTLPFQLRLRLAYDAELTNAVLRVHARAVGTWIRRRTGRAGRPGGVTHIQRFGSAANLNVHFHSLFADGVFDDAEPAAHFIPARPPTAREVQRLLATIRRRILRLLRRRGLEDLDLNEAPVLLGCAQASMTQRQLFDPDRQVERERDVAHDGAPLSQLAAALGGFTLHAGTRIPPHDREGLERLCRYVARPPIPADRLHLRADGRYVLTLKTPWTDGTRAFVFDPLDLLGRLVSLIPAPRRKLLRYHGVYAPNARRRPFVVPRPPPTPAGTAAPKTPRRRALLWAELMRRVFDIDPLDCPRCPGRLKLIALIDKPKVISRILTHLRWTARAPPAQLELDLSA